MVICLFYKAILDNESEIIKEDLIEFNFAIKNKQVNSIEVDDGDNQAVINFVNGNIFVQDNVKQENIDLQLSQVELDELKLLSFKPVLFRRVFLVRGISDRNDLRSEKYFFGWCCNKTDSIVYRLVSLDNGEFVLHLVK
jgi:hypothetical protein